MLEGLLLHLGHRPGRGGARWERRVSRLLSLLSHPRRAHFDTAVQHMHTHECIHMNADTLSTLSHLCRQVVGQNAALRAQFADTLRPVLSVLGAQRAKRSACYTLKRTQQRRCRSLEKDLLRSPGSLAPLSHLLF